MKPNGSGLRPQSHTATILAEQFDFVVVAFIIVIGDEHAVMLILSELSHHAHVQCAEVPGKAGRRH